MGYLLEGTFIESCNCRVICPCWVDDRPTEDHCAGFFAWEFGADSTIDDVPVAGRKVVVVTVHSDRRRGGESEAVVFVDADPHNADPAYVGATEALKEIFAIDDPERTDPVADLAPTLGLPIVVRDARITVGRTRDGYDVRVKDGESIVVDAVLSRSIFDEGSLPLRLSGTALDREMGVGPDHAFTAHRAKRLSMHIGALADASADLVGRSGMAGSFRYDALLDDLTGGRRRVGAP